MATPPSAETQASANSIWLIIGLNFMACVVGVFTFFPFALNFRCAGGDALAQDRCC